MVGSINSDHTIHIKHQNKIVFEDTRSNLQSAWTETSFRMQSIRDNPECALEEFSAITDDLDPGLNPKFDFAIPQSFAIAKKLQAEGAKVAIFDRDISKVPETFLAIAADITDDNSVKSAVSNVVAKFGGIDIVSNNAGIGAAGDVAANLDDEWHRVYDVNVVGIARVTRAALPHLKKSKHGAIVNTASVVVS